MLVQYFDVQPFIASLAGLFLARGLAFVVSLESIRVEDPVVLWLQRTRFQVAGAGTSRRPASSPCSPWRSPFYVLLWTRFGRTVYAIGGGEQSARLMGLNVARTKVMVYVISGVCGGLAGLLLTAYSGAGYPRNGIGTELDAIAAVVIGGTLLTGGTGYVLGSLIGVLVYGTIKKRHLVHGRRAGVDADHHRRAAAAVHRRAARHRRALAATQIAGRRRDGAHAEQRDRARFDRIMA